MLPIGADLGCQENCFFFAIEHVVLQESCACKFFDDYS
jgi:hypothetical protein